MMPLTWVGSPALRRHRACGAGRQRPCRNAKRRPGSFSTGWTLFEMLNLCVLSDAAGCASSFGRIARWARPPGRHGVAFQGWPLVGRPLTIVLGQAAGSVRGAGAAARRPPRGRRDGRDRGWPRCPPCARAQGRSDPGPDGRPAVGGPTWSARPSGRRAPARGRLRRVFAGERIGQAADLAPHRQPASRCRSCSGCRPSTATSTPPRPGWPVPRPPPGRSAPARSRRPRRPPSSPTGRPGSSASGRPSPAWGPR